MGKSAKHFLFEGFLVVKENYNYAVVPASLVYLPVYFTKLPFFIIPIIWLIIIPLLYGQFIQIITFGQKDIWLNIFNKYWSKVFLLNLILEAPAFLLGLAFPEMPTLKAIISIIIVLLSIYILPLVLLRNEIISSIKLGVMCLLGNLKYSFPLIFVRSFFIFIKILLKIIVFNHFRAPSLTISDTIEPLILSGAIVLLIIETTIEFTIFVSATLILKEKLLTIVDERS